MKVLLTGVTGYIGSRLVSLLVKNGHQVVVLVRSLEKLLIPKAIQDKVTLLKGDVLKDFHLPSDIEAAYYLIHSMSGHLNDFEQRDQLAATRFKAAIEKTDCRQVVYLTGLISSASLSKHLSSRLKVEQILRCGSVPLTALRCGIIIGLGGASFKIIQDLVEKLPIIVAPKWVKNFCQPIALQDVLFYLIQVLKRDDCMGKTFDIGGPDILTYQQMLLEYARMRHLRRLILTVPFLTPRLSSYWLVFITSVDYSLARCLVEGLKGNVVCTEQAIHNLFPRRRCLSYRESLKQTLQGVGQTDPF